MTTTTQSLLAAIAKTRAAVATKNAVTSTLERAVGKTAWQASGLAKRNLKELAAIATQLKAKDRLRRAYSPAPCDPTADAVVKAAVPREPTCRERFSQCIVVVEHLVADNYAASASELKDMVTCLASYLTKNHGVNGLADPNIATVNRYFNSSVSPTCPSYISPRTATRMALSDAAQYSNVGREAGKAIRLNIAYQLSVSLLAEALMQAPSRTPFAGPTFSSIPQ